MKEKNIQIKIRMRNYTLMKYIDTIDSFNIIRLIESVIDAWKHSTTIISSDAVTAISMLLDILKYSRINGVDLPFKKVSIGNVTIELSNNVEIVADYTLSMLIYEAEKGVAKKEKPTRYNRVRIVMDGKRVAEVLGVEA